MDNTEALSNMLKVMDFDAEDLIRVVSAQGEIKKKKDEKKEAEGNKFSVDKTNILGKDDCWIYRDNRTKAKWWQEQARVTRKSCWSMPCAAAAASPAHGAKPWSGSPSRRCAPSPK